MTFEIVAGLVAALAGAVASVAGFGIGSLLTPVLSLRLGTKLAVAAVSIPHMTATALRFWMLKEHIDRKVLWSFGLTSAAGGLAGALLHSFAASRALSMLFGSLLIFTGLMGVTGLEKRLEFKGWVAWAAGGVSGFLGGMVGNQGGIRAGGLLGFNVPKEAFVATATAIGLIVDGARLPVYLATESDGIGREWLLIATTTVGAIVGTLLGGRVLKRIPEHVFRPVVSGIILLLGVYMLLKPGG